jgi:hypothetical protein
MTKISMEKLDKKFLDLSLNSCDLWLQLGSLIDSYTGGDDRSRHATSSPKG